MHMTRIFDSDREAEKEINRLCEQGWKIKIAKVEMAGGGASYSVRVRYLYVLEKPIGRNGQ